MTRITSSPLQRIIKGASAKGPNAMTTILQQQFAASATFVKRKLEDSHAETTPRAANTLAFNDEDQALVEECNRALRAWRSSADYQAFRASLPKCDIEQVKAYLDSVLRGPIFARTLELSTSPSLSSLVPQSISVGLAGQIELLVGAYASFGYMVNLSTDGGRAVYLLGALAEGLDITIDISEQVGLWLDKVDDVSGSYIGGELEVDEGVGVSGFLLLHKDDPKAVMIDIDEGIGDGAAGLEFYMLAHGTSDNPVAQPPKSHMLILTNLECVNAGENKGDGHDDVYLKFTIDGDDDTEYRYPTYDNYGMKPGDKDGNWALGRSIWLDSKASIEVWDNDDTNDDKRFTFTINVSDFSGVGSSHAKTYDQKSSSAEYKLTAYLMDLNA